MTCFPEAAGKITCEVDLVPIDSLVNPVTISCQGEPVETTSGGAQVETPTVAGRGATCAEAHATDPVQFLASVSRSLNQSGQFHAR